MASHLIHIINPKMFRFRFKYDDFKKCHDFAWAKKMLAEDAKRMQTDTYEAS